MIVEAVQSYLEKNNKEWAEHYVDKLSSLDMRPISEQWKNFPLVSVLSPSLIPLFPTQPIEVDTRLLSLRISKRTDVYTIVFYNGVMVPEASDTVPGLSIVTEPAIQRTEYAHVGELMAHAISHPSLIHVDTDCPVDKPLRIVHYLQTAGAELAVPAMCTIAVEPGVSLQVIEECIVDADVRVFDMRYTEYRVYEGASLHVTRVMPGHDKYTAMTSTRALVSDNATHTMIMVGACGIAERHDLEVRLSEGAHAELYVASAPRKKQVRNVFTRCVHTSPDSTSNQVMRSVPFDFGKSTFDGMIYVAPDAQRVDAKFYGKTLMMSEHAKSYVYPKLEIYADDVKCAHGASIGHVLPEHMEYMRSRGMGEMNAKSMLAFAFLQEVYDQIPHEWLRTQSLKELERIFYLS